MKVIADKCKHCGGSKSVRNPTGGCDHLYWPDNLTDEARQANGLGRREISDEAFKRLADALGATKS